MRVKTRLARFAAFSGIMVSIFLLAVVFSGSPVSAATYGAQGNHLYFVLDVENTFLIAVNVLDAARTREHKEGVALITEWHYNDVEIVDGRCHYFFPFCFDAPYGPQIRYTNDSGSYTLTDFSYLGCIGPWENLISCWQSYTWLGWYPPSGTAEASRYISIADYPAYQWWPNLTPWKVSNTPTYQVY